MPKIHKKSVHFGAGNIGRGFIAPLLVQSGYHVTFIDIQDNIIDALNKDRQYTVHILDSEDITRQDSQQIRHVSASKTTEDSTLDFIAEAEIITTSVGAKVLEKIGPTIAEGLLRRHERGRGANDLSVIACENLIGATDNLKEYITTTLTSKGHEDIHLILKNVGFPNCEVDRIVPPFRGLTPLDVGVEGFYEWTVEKGKIRPPNLEVKGMQLQDSLEPFFERKLYTLNCGHAMLAFIGHIKGFKTMDEAIGDVDCKHIAKYALRESGAALIRRHGFNEEEHAEYINRTMERYANPNIKDELARVARNPLHKLSPNERLVGAVNMCREYDLPRKHLIKGIAAAFYFDLQEDEEAVQLVQLVEEKGIEAAIEETTGFKKGSRDHEDVFREYFEMGKFAK